ncbi:MAG: hypothetical protein MMC33_007031 [Icmadophila ericetorum]|nr:hypothetical protein [Icmadophila ericetorum]
MEYQVIREMNQPLVGHQGAGENTRTQSGYRKSRDTQQERHEETEKIERIHKYLQEITTSTEIKMKVTGATSQKSAQCLTLIHSRGETAEAGYPRTRLADSDTDESYNPRGRSPVDPYLSWSGDRPRTRSADSDTMEIRKWRGTFYEITPPFAEPPSGLSCYRFPPRSGSRQVVETRPADSDIIDIQKCSGPSYEPTPLLKSHK